MERRLSALQSTEHEYPGKCNFLRPGSVQAPDVGQREYHQRDIRQDIGDRVSEQELFGVDVAYSRLGPIPHTGDRITLEDSHQDLNR